MSVEDGSVSLAFGDGEYRFRIAFGQWRELQEAINKPRIEIGEPPVGPVALGRALAAGTAWPSDAREIIRIALIGGGLKSDRALVLVKRYVEAQPFFQSVLLAQAILHVAMFGPPDDPVGKEAASPNPEEATTELSSLGSTGSVLQ